jgi:hypothetical protein
MASSVVLTLSLKIKQGVCNPSIEINFSIEIKTRRVSERLTVRALLLENIENNLFKIAGSFTI